MIEEALGGAHAELAVLRRRQTELENQIAQAEVALGNPPAIAAEPAERMTLHTALTHVLRENSNRWMTARELADVVNRRGLYRKRDGSSVEANQVHARTNNYDAIFEKEGANIRLREPAPALSTHPPSITVFRDDDPGYFQWLDENTNGYFINTERNPKPAYLVLHHAVCPHIDRSTAVHWTKDYIKICSRDRVELEEWAEEAVSGEVTLCRSCFGS